MHRMWHIEELLRAVVLECSPSTAVLLGRTCKSFFGVVANEIWGRLATLTALAGLVQSKLQGDDSNQTRDKSLRRLKYYASRVYTLVLSEEPGAEHQLRQVLSCCGGQQLSSIFRRLKCLHINSNTVDFLVDASRLAFPSLICLTLDIAPDDDRYAVDVTALPPGTDLADLGRLLPMRGAERLGLFSKRLRRLNLPRLDALHVYARNDPEKDVTSFLNIVSQSFPSIENLTLDILPLPNHSFISINAFKAIKELKLTLDEDHEFPEQWPLPQLVNVQLDITFFEPCFEFFSSLNAPSLNTIHIAPSSTAASYLTGPSEDFRRLSEVIAAKFPELDMYALCGILLADNSEEQHHWTFEPFHPLLKCHHLTTLTVRSDHRILIRDRDFVQIGLNLPDLQSLILECPQRVACPKLSYITEPPRTTIGGLLIAARMCRNLAGLTIYINLEGRADDARDRAAFGELISSPSESRLSVLEVEDAPPCDAEATATLLRQLFPRLEGFLYSPKNEAVLDNKEWSTLEDKRVTCMEQIVEILGVHETSTLITRGLAPVTVRMS